MSFSVVSSLDHFEGFHDRDAGLHEHAELAGEVHDLFAGHLFLGDLELRGGSSSRHLERLEAALEQGQMGGPRVARQLDARDLLAPVAVERAVAESWPWSCVVLIACTCS